MPKEQISPTVQAVIRQIRKSPSLFVPTKEELQKIIAEREKADQRLKEARTTVILQTA